MHDRAIEEDTVVGGKHRGDIARTQATPMDTVRGRPMGTRPDSVERIYEVAIFDFDGTLVDTAPLYPLLHREALRDIVDPESLPTLDGFHRFLSDHRDRATRDLPDLLMDELGLSGRITREELCLTRNQVEIDYFRGERAIEGAGSPDRYPIHTIIDAAKRHHAQGAECAIVSRNYAMVVTAVLEALGIRGLFDDMRTCCSYDSMMMLEFDRCEEKEESYRDLLRSASSPAACIVYDDTIDHIETAVSLGMEAMLVSTDHARPRSPETHGVMGDTNATDGGGV